MTQLGLAFLVCFVFIYSYCLDLKTGNRAWVWLGEPQPPDPLSGWPHQSHMSPGVTQGSCWWEGPAGWAGTDTLTHPAMWIPLCAHLMNKACPMRAVLFIKPLVECCHVYLLICYPLILWWGYSSHTHFRDGETVPKHIKCLPNGDNNAYLAGLLWRLQVMYLTYPNGNTAQWLKA